MFAKESKLRKGRRDETARAGELFLNLNDTVGSLVRWLPQQDGVDDAEDSSIRPDAERQRDQRQRGKSRRFEENPDPEADVLQHALRFARTDG
jgi:hypothetical protein